MDKSLLLKPRLPEDKVEIAGLGAVTVRGLSRDEVLEFRKSDLDQDEFELKLISACMVDPQLTEDEVREWRRGSLQGEIEDVTVKINELSGLTRAADKETYKSLPDEPGTGVRALPGGEAGDDGSPAAG